MSSDIETWRRRQRTALTAARLAATVAERQRWSAIIVQHLLAGFPALAPLRIGFFSPFRGEPDVRPAVDHWRQRGAVTALPVVAARHAPLEFRAWWPGAPMTRGVFAIPIPDGTDRVTPQALLIPPLGFDARGYRLGYGGGYYDRTLAALSPLPLTVAVAFELSRMADLNPQAYDLPMDFVITERGIHAVTPAGMDRLAGSAQAQARVAALIAARGLGPAPLRSGTAALASDVIECASPPCYAGEMGPDYGGAH